MPGPGFKNSNTSLENANLRETNMYISPNFGDNSLHLQTRLSKNLDALPTFYVEPLEKRVVETYTIVKGKRIKNTYRLSESGRSYGIDTPATNAYTFQNDVQNLVLSDNAENVIRIENVGEQLISEAVDALDPGKVFRENFIVYDVENDINYIYTGSENTYGVNEDEQANEEDFVIIPSEAELPQSLSDFGDDIGATEREVIKVTEKSQIVNKDLDATKVYKILRSLSLTSTETIRLNNSPIIKSLGADLITISTSEPDSIIFEGDNCKNVNIQDINLSAAGNGSKVFDVINAEGNHEFRLIGVNFSGSESAGNITGFRQWFTKDIGLYGCKDGFTLYGPFNGMFCQELNLFGFPATGTLFKKGEGLTFTNRAFISVNFAVPSGAVLADFDESVFLENELFQLVNCIAKVDGGFNDNNVNSLVPNISANSPKSLWSGNSGLPNTAIEKIVIDDNVNGSYEIDWLNDTYDLTLTADTIFTEKNLPASGRRTKTINISISGDFTPTFPEEWTFNQVGSYKGDDLNRMIVTYLSNAKYITQIINSLSAFPAPLPTSFTPSSALPNTGNLLIDVEGSYFKPGMKIEISDWTITQQIVKTDNKIQLIVDVGETEGDAVVKMNNGAESITQNLFFVSTGTVYIPQEEEFTDLVGNLDLIEPGEATLTNYNVDESATWNRELDYTKNWALIFSGRQSNLGVPQNAGPLEIQLIKVSDGSTAVSANFKTAGQQRQFCFFRAEETNEAANAASFNNTFSMEENKLEIRCFNGLISFYDNDNLLLETSQAITENLKMKITLDTYNVFNMKYIEY